MKYNNIFKNRTFRIFLIFLAIVIVVLIILRLTIYDSDTQVSFIASLYDAYLYLSEGIANQLFKWSNTEVLLRGHSFIFENQDAYEQARNFYLSGWTRFLLHRNWSILILVLIWGTFSPIGKKIVFSLLFFVAHLLAMVCGLYMIGIVGPALYVVKPEFLLSPTYIGTLIWYIFIAVWFKLCHKDVVKTIQKIKIKFTLSDKGTNEILLVFFFILLFKVFLQTSFLIGIFAIYLLFAIWLKRRKLIINQTLSKLKIDISISGRKINEFLVVIFILLLIQSYLLPGFEFKHYVRFLLTITQWIVSVFNYDSMISGDLLIGNNGTMWLGNHCLGFLSMILFASMIYLSRVNNRLSTWLFIASGLVILMIFNISRFALVFILAQGTNGFEIANDHHKIYNIIIYAVIFVMWVLWFEYFVRVRKKINKK